MNLRLVRLGVTRNVGGNSVDILFVDRQLHLVLASHLLDYVLQNAVVDDRLAVLQDGLLRNDGLDLVENAQDFERVFANIQVFLLDLPLSPSRQLLRLDAEDRLSLESDAFDFLAEDHDLQRVLNI